MTPEADALLPATVWFLLPVLLAAVLLSVLAALLERSGPIRLRHWARESAGSLQRLYESATRFEVFRFLLSWLAKVAAAALMAMTLVAIAGAGWQWGVPTAFAVVAGMLGLTELLNRSLVSHDPEHALRRLTLVYRLALLALSPLVAVLAPLVPARALARREENDEDEASDEEIEAFIRVGAHEGILEPDEEEMLRGIVDFGDTLVRSVMTPRIDMVCAPVDSNLETLAALFLESNHSRLPLYHESIDDVVGILHLRDLLKGLRARRPTKTIELGRPPYFVPETKRLDQLLKEFQQRHLQMAIVVDEYGGTAGLVTMQDLLEEIVGEIPGEYEEPHAINEPLGDGSWRFDGRAHLEELESVFGVDLEEADYETVGGLIFGALGYVPREGESVTTFGLRFTVEKVAERRVLSVIVAPQVASTENGAHE